MPTTINVNNLSLCHKDSGGFSAATLPDVCRTPPGSAPVAYPNVATQEDLAKGTTSVLADGGNSCAHGDSEFSRSTGDEPGTDGGVSSGTFMKEATWLTFSFDVKLEGKGACRLTDKMLHNHENTGNTGGKVQDPLQQDEELIQCILEMCMEDRAVVDDAREKLTLIARNPERLILNKYENGQWTRSDQTGLGSQHGTTIEVNRGRPCEATQQTVYHEVTHARQDPEMNPAKKEIDAYTKTEEWMNKKGKVGRFWKLGADGKPTVDHERILDHVKNSYGYQIPTDGSPPPSPVWRILGPGIVQLRDYTMRPVREGDAFIERPPQDLKKQQIPKDRLRCPPAAGGPSGEKGNG